MKNRKGTFEMTWRDHLDYADNQTVLAEFDDGSAVLLASYSGGSSEAGVFGELSLMQVSPTGEVFFRRYRAVGGWINPELLENTE